MNAFVHTNILLDALLRREPHFASSTKIWSLADDGTIKGYVSAISFNNVYYLMRRQENRIRARESLRLINAAFTVVSLDNSILEKSIRSTIDDFEDAIQYFSALQVSAKCLITRNSGHFPKKGIAIISPEQFLKQNIQITD